MISGVTQVASSLSFCPKPEANTPVIINNYNCTYNDILFHLENIFLIKINNFTFFFFYLSCFFPQFPFMSKTVVNCSPVKLTKKKLKALYSIL